MRGGKVQSALRPRVEGCTWAGSWGGATRRGRLGAMSLRLGLRPLSYPLLLLWAVGTANRVQRIIEATACRRRRLRRGHSVFRSVQHGSRARWCSFRGMNVSRCWGQAASGLLAILLRFKEECHREILYHKSSWKRQS